MSMPFISAPEKEKVWVEIRMWGGLNSEIAVHRTLEGARKSFEAFCDDYSAKELDAYRDEGNYQDSDDYMHLYDADDRHTPEIIVEAVYVED